MHLHYRHKRKKLISEINVVPYIDVMLVLLVIFMITAPLMAQGVKVTLPQTKAQAVDSRRPETLVVTVDRTGRYFLDDKAITPGALVDRVGAALRLNPKTSVLVRGDAQANYGEVVKLMALLQDAGAPGVGLLTEPPRQN
jgi:biopolymer transport protein TolR